MLAQCSKTYYFKHFNIFCLSFVAFFLRMACRLRLEDDFGGKWLKVGVDRFRFVPYGKAVLRFVNFGGSHIPQPTAALHQVGDICQMTILFLVKKNFK